MAESLFWVFIALILSVLVSEAHLASPLTSHSRFPSSSDHCIVCIDDHCNVPSPLELIWSLNDVTYFSFCCEEGLGGWCNSSFSMKGIGGSNYFYYIWNVTSPAETCPPLISLPSNIDCSPRGFSSPPMMINDVIAVPQGSCYAASVLCLAGSETNQSCTAQFEFQPSLLPSQYCHLNSTDHPMQVVSLPQCSGAFVCLNGVCEMCPNSMTHWNPCQCTTSNGTVYPCLPCQQAASPQPLSVPRILSKPALQFPTCEGSYACMEEACAMCPAQSLIFCNFTDFSCSNEAEPITCLPDAQHQNIFCPLNASAVWVWDITTPLSLGAGSSTCLINNAAPGPDPWNYAMTGISQPYIYNDNLHFSVGYVPEGEGDCSNFVTLGSFSCDSDGTCFAYGLGQLSFPTPPGARAAVLIDCANLWETCKATFEVSVCNLSL